MQTTTRRKGSTYMITTRDKNPATGKVDVLCTIEPDGGFGFNAGYIRRDTDGFMTGTRSLPLPLVEEAKHYFASCSMSETREIQHPTECGECKGWVPFGSEECPKCAEFFARQEEGRRRLRQMFPGIAA